MDSLDDELVPVLLDLLGEGHLDSASAQMLALHLATHWSSSPWNEYADLLQRADCALGAQGSSLMEWFGQFYGLPSVISISNATYAHLQGAYDLLDEHEDQIAERLAYCASEVPTTFIATIEAGLGTGDHRLAGLGAIDGLFGLETAYAAEGVYDQSVQARQTRNLLFTQLRSVPLR